MQLDHLWAKSECVYAMHHMSRKRILTIIVCILGAFILFLAGVFVARENRLAGWMPAANSGPDPGQVRAPAGSATLYGKIETMDLKTGEARFRLVEWVPGSDNQEQTALEVGRCSLEQIENDACLSNPFIIRDTEKQMTLPFSPNVRIQVRSPGPSGEIKQDQDQNTILRDIASADFVKMIAHASFSETIPFILTTMHGVITDIQEQYVP